MRLIDTFSTNKLGDLEYCAGRVLPFGATIIDGGVNFSVFSKEATGCTLVLYHHGQDEPFAEIPFPDEFRIGNVYAMMVFGLACLWHWQGISAYISVTRYISGNTSLA